MRFYQMTLFLILFSMLLFVFFGCESPPEPPPPPPPGPTPSQQWEHFINMQKALGYEVLSVAASQEWIEKHSDEISIPNQIAFGEPHIISELPFIGTRIAIDANDKRRVLIIPEPPPPPGPPFHEKFGYLNEAQSLRWLSENGYEVEKSSNGAITIKKHVQRGSIDYAMDRNIGHARIIGMELEKGVFLTAFDGKIYIKDER